MIHPVNCIVTEPPSRLSVSQLGTALDLVNIVDMAYMPLLKLKKMLLVATVSGFIRKT
jgi:hypothetical protein